MVFTSWIIIMCMEPVLIRAGWKGTFASYSETSHFLISQNPKIITELDICVGGLHSKFWRLFNTFVVYFQWICYTDTVPVVIASFLIITLTSFSAFTSLGASRQDVQLWSCWIWSCLSWRYTHARTHIMLRLKNLVSVSAFIRSVD
jgi:hypothetical protein